jgi:hypothetical protein
MTPVYKLEFGSNGVRLVGGCRWLDGNHPQENTIPMESYLLMQYTGLKDKNGVDLYEDDILESDSGGRYRVVWNDCIFGPSWEMKFLPDYGGDYNTFADYPAFEMAIIGNAYENPELLEVEL